MLVRSGPTLPPCPSAPWHETQLFANTVAPATALPCAALAPPPPSACCVPVPLPGAGTGGSLPSRPNSQRLSPCGVAASELPPERNAMYSLPFCWKIVDVLFAPAPVWKLQSRAPVAALYACSWPWLRPTKTRLPAVVAVPEEQGSGNVFCHPTLPLVASIAVSGPVSSGHAKPAVPPTPASGLPGAI